MTASEDAKAIKLVIKKIRGIFMKNGFVGLETGRMSKSFEKFAHVVELNRVGQTNLIRIRYGIVIFASDCQHLHSTVNGVGTEFYIMNFGEAENMIEITRYCHNCVFPSFESFATEESLLAIN